MYKMLSHIVLNEENEANPFFCYENLDGRHWIKILYQKKLVFGCTGPYKYYTQLCT